MAEEQVIPIEETETPLSPEQENVMVNEQLALVPASDKAEIEKVVKPQDLVLIGKHKSKLTTFKRKYLAKNFAITEGMVYNKVLHDKAIDAQRDIRNYRTKTVEPDFKNLKAPYTALLNFYNATCNPVIEDFKNLQSPVDDYIKKMKALKEEEDQREEKERETRTGARVKELIDAGAAFDGNYYSVGSEEFEVSPISIGMADINAMSDEIFNNMFEQLKVKAATIATKQKEKENAAAELEKQNKIKAQQEQEKLQQEQQKLREKNMRLRSKELSLLDFVLVGDKYSSHGFEISKHQVEEMEMDDWDLLIADAEKKINSDKKQTLLKERITKRYDQLFALGLKYNGEYDAYVLGSINVDNKTEINLFDDAEWSALIEKVEAAIPREKEKILEKEIEQQRRSELQNARFEKLHPYNPFGESVDMATLWSLSEDRFNEVFNQKKGAYEKKVTDDAKVQSEKEQKQKAELLAKQGDEAVYNDLVARLKEVVIPEVKTDQFKNKIATITNFINGLK